MCLCGCPPALPACRSKTRTERRGEPAFSTLVEVLSRNRWRVHMSVARSVDSLLAGRWVGARLGGWLGGRVGGRLGPTNATTCVLA